MLPKGSVTPCLPCLFYYHSFDFLQPTMKKEQRGYETVILLKGLAIIPQHKTEPWTVSISSGIIKTEQFRWTHCDAV